MGGGRRPQEKAPCSLQDTEGAGHCLGLEKALRGSQHSSQEECVAFLGLVSARGTPVALGGGNELPATGLCKGRLPGGHVMGQQGLLRAWCPSCPLST